VLDLLSGFVTELRDAGLPVSLTEHLDAAEAIHYIPLEDRTALKYALAATLVKSSDHWRAFETAFEVYFAHRTLTEAAKRAKRVPTASCASRPPAEAATVPVARGCPELVQATR